MARLNLNILHVLALSQQKACVGMPKVMKFDRLQPGRFQCRRKMPPDRITTADRHSLFRWGNKAFILTAALQLPPRKRLDNYRRKIDFPDRSFRYVYKRLSIIFVCI